MASDFGKKATNAVQGIKDLIQSGSAENTASSVRPTNNQIDFSYDFQINDKGNIEFIIHDITISNTKNNRNIQTISLNQHITSKYSNIECTGTTLKQIQQMYRTSQ